MRLGLIMAATSTIVSYRPQRELRKYSKRKLSIFFGKTVLLEEGPTEPIKVVIIFEWIEIGLRMQLLYKTFRSGTERRGSLWRRVRFSRGRRGAPPEGAFASPSRARRGFCRPNQSAPAGLASASPETGLTCTWLEI